MTAAVCRCSHVRARHQNGTGDCWSVACGCYSFRPRPVVETKPDEDRCPRSDLPPEMCAHCRGHIDGPRLVLDDTVLDRDDLGPRFPASFDGRCAVCDDHIEVGDCIAMLVDGSGPSCRRHHP